jgi:ADP-ribosyl-[dinitrogen reductase] hydrolase
MSLRGRCLCGAIAYEVTQPDGPIVHCHCTTCRKAHASAFASTARVMREHFRWLTGGDRLGRYPSSPGKWRWFCGSCGSHLMAERPAQPHVILRVGTLDDDPGTTPAMHIWTSHAVPWLDAADDAPRYAEMPG